ncbi:MAG TPA: hypothetical protein VJ183_10790 [Chloroflexia bacterium]|nr:hypothetical protein [Chloroflexia bacterium]
MPDQYSPPHVSAPGYAPANAHPDAMRQLPYPHTSPHIPTTTYSPADANPHTMRQLSYPHSLPNSPTMANQATYDSTCDASATGYSHADAHPDAMRQLPDQHAPPHARAISYPPANGYEDAPPRYGYAYVFRRGLGLASRPALEIQH